MAENGTPSAIRDSDYDALFNALSETDRGRRFLQEYLVRNQKPDTQIVLDAIGRLEKVMTRERTVPDLDRIRLDIADMQEAIERTKREIANIKHEAEEGNRFVEASNELDAIVTQTESATQEILAAAEAIQEHAWTLRESGADQAICDDIDGRATEIFMACSFQDLTGQRTQKIVQVLQYLESRINLMISIWGIEDVKGEDTEIRQDSRPDAHLLNGPQLKGRGVCQNTVDELFSQQEETPSADAHAAEQAQIDAAFEGMDDMAGLVAGATVTDDDLDALFANTATAEDDEETSGADGEADVFAAPAPAAAPDTGLGTAALDLSAEDLVGADIFASPDVSDKTKASTEVETGAEAPDASPVEADHVEAEAAPAEPEDDVVIVDEADDLNWRNDEDSPKEPDPLDRLSPGERQSLFS
ncbi:protein phosphatase CheZ [Stappia indica]|uniref:protein phosphatase CheZ n=1 Tax=Stappia indica TaxID=538381 RepID=UPI001CD704B1|nr:protein phosphatase CheZ [Stappia indica]MCA1298872.1 protein phosphatase CheZ [Stappia indica]